MLLQQLLILARKNWYCHKFQLSYVHKFLFTESARSCPSSNWLEQTLEKDYWHPFFSEAERYQATWWGTHTWTACSWGTVYYHRFLYHSSGTTNYVYPSATHTRFEHSLGYAWVYWWSEFFCRSYKYRTAFLAEKMLQSLWTSTARDIHKEKNQSLQMQLQLQQMNETEYLCVAIAGLCHDLGMPNINNNYYYAYCFGFHIVITN